MTDDLIEAARRYEFPGPLPRPPARHTAIVACMDARFEPARLFGFALGDAHVIRNAGGAITDDTLRSLTVSQRVMGTTDVVLVHHTGCGMLSFDDAAFRRQIEEETGIRPHWTAESFSDVDTDVRQSIRRIHLSPFLPHTDRVRGFVYDVETGQVREIVSS
jgi:carbonic anhydrase